ncbi:uncharacterized protein LOC108603577 [Drosophila busckii]|uniref:uncharacterized protein LOC108603577 n=1 Tax=Drosophila busckii TaxID=30019 RepID=UPI00143293A9|nr:uncharacterized protein LOC108603577 [Drosophila busckii]
MPWMATMLAALALHWVAGNRFGSNYNALMPNPGKPCSRFLGLGDCMDKATSQEDDTSKMLSSLLGLVPSTAATPRPTEAAALTPYQLPPMYYNDFYEDLLTSKRNDVHAASCDCKVMNDLIDLGSKYFPRYLMSAVCETPPTLDAKCLHGSNCKPLEYKVKVLTLTPELVNDKSAASAARLWLPEKVTQLWQWQFETVTVTAGCFCAN